MKGATRAAVWTSLAKGWQLPSVAGGLAGLFVILAVAPDLVVLPQVSSDVPVLAPSTTVAATVASLLVLATSPEPVEPLFATAPRGRQRLRILRVAAVTLAAVVALGLCDPRHLLETAIAMLVLSGEGLLIAPLIGSRLCWILPLSHSLAATAFGAGRTGDVAAWAWFFAEASSPVGTVAAVGIFASGLVVTYVKNPKW